MNLRALERLMSQDWHILPSAVDPLLLAILSQSPCPQGEGGVPAGSLKKPGRKETPLVGPPYAEQNDPCAERPTHDCNGDAIAQMQITSAGVAIVPVNGPLVHMATGSDKRDYGVSSYSDIAEDMDQALAEGASSILLNIHSPGGSVLGLAEMAAKIEEVSRAVDVYSYNSGLCASAAEYLSAGAAMRFGLASSVNGSIGTMLTTIDISKLLEKFGITVNLFTSGRYKGTGNPAKALTDDQRDFLQGWVNQAASDFKNHMAMHRGLEEGHMQGQIFNGRQAREIGLLDELVRSRAEVLGMI